MEVLIFLLIWLGSAVACGAIADSKGRSAGGWFALGLCFGVIAVVIIAVAPKPDAPAAQEILANETAMPADARPCPICAEIIKKAALKCRFCGAEVAPAPPPSPAV